MLRGFLFFNSLRQAVKQSSAYHIKRKNSLSKTKIKQSSNQKPKSIRPNIVHMKTIIKCFKKKDHEYERVRKRFCVHNTQIRTLNTFQINQQQQACGTDKYENAHTQAFAIDLSRSRAFYFQNVLKTEDLRL